jgi:hypothetical protein
MKIINAVSISFIPVRCIIKEKAFEEPIFSELMKMPIIGIMIPMLKTSEIERITEPKERNSIPFFSLGVRIEKKLVNRSGTKCFIPKLTFQ